MEYEKTPVSRKVKPETARKQVYKAIDQLNAAQLVWYLIKRYKIAILVTGNIILVLNWAIPEWPTIIKSLV